MKIPFKKTADSIIITIRVVPRSSRKGIEVMGDGIKVKLTAPPVDGAANEQLIEILSEALGIRKSSFRIVRGLSSKNKVVEVKGVQGI